MADRYLMGVRELDLRDCSPSYMADRVVPGLRNSAAFFTFLRANLVLSPSAVSSNTNTPYLEPWTSQTLPSVLPSPLGASPPLEALEDIPPLSLEPLQTEDDKISGLELVADSVADMRRVASQALVSHPVSLGALFSAWAVTYHYVYSPTRNIELALLVASGLLVIYLMSIRYIAAGYIRRSRLIDRHWLRTDHRDDIILGARVGDEVAATLVLHLEPKAQPPNKRKSRDACLKGGRGLIRAWTTKPKHRGRGLGKDLLKEAIQLTKEKCGRDAEVEFAPQHANANMILPSIFNGAFKKGEARATKTLDEMMVQREANKRRKR